LDCTEAGCPTNGWKEKFETKYGQASSLVAKSEAEEAKEKDCRWCFSNAEGQTVCKGLKWMLKKSVRKLICLKCKEEGCPTNGWKKKFEKKYGQASSLVAKSKAEGSKEKVCQWCFPQGGQTVCKTLKWRFHVNIRKKICKKCTEEGCPTDGFKEKFEKKYGQASSLVTKSKDEGSKEKVCRWCFSQGGQTVCKILKWRFHVNIRKKICLKCTEEGCPTDGFTEKFEKKYGQASSLAVKPDLVERVRQE